MRRTTAVLLLTALAALAFWGCGGKKEAAAAPENILYTNGGPVEFFQNTAVNPGAPMYSKFIFDRLITSDPGLTPTKGQLAESYSLNDDGLTLEIKLRNGVKWHDGEDFDGEDVRFTIEYMILIPGLNAVAQSTFSSLTGAQAFLDGTASGIEGIEIDGMTVRLNFDRVDPNALMTFSQWPPLPEHLLKDADPLSDQQNAYWQKPVGTGPFAVTEVQMNNYTVLNRFADYWDKSGTGNIEKIHMSPSEINSDPNIVVNAEAGRLDYGYTKSISDVKGIQGISHMRVTPVDIRYARLFYFNKFPQPDELISPLADVRVRQAIAYAIDMDTLAATLLEGMAKPANSLTEDGPWKTGGLSYYKRDVEKAKSLLAEAGWDSSEELAIAAYYQDQQTVDLMTAVQAQLSEVGINTTFSVLSGDLASQLWVPPQDRVNGPSEVKWDILYAGIGALVLDEFYGRFSSTAANNSNTPADPVIDELVERARATADIDKQKEAYFELQRYENETLFELPLYYQQIFICENNRVDRNGAPHGNDQFTYDWRIIDWNITHAE